MTKLSSFLSAAAIAFVLTMPSVMFADSQVRMVRLSDVEGNVQVDRNNGNGFEKALLNMPVVQGTRIATGGSGRAEIELEDGTAIRVAPNTNLNFPELVLRDSGARATTAELTLGTLYFNVKHKKKDELQLKFAQQTIAIDHDVRFRATVDLAKAKLAVFNGELKVPAGAETATLKKDETLTLDLVDEKQVATAKGIDTLPTDNWDAERSQFQKQYGGSVYASTPYGNAPDMAYYGTYSLIPGYGIMWQPYGAGLNWNPFLNGAWIWDASVGYSWVSMDPWGWYPYHYGAWNYVPGYGWGWVPTRSHVWQPNPHIVRQPAGFQVPTAPVAARNAARQPTVIVGQKPTAVGAPAAAYNGNLGRVPAGAGRGEIVRGVPPPGAANGRSYSPGYSSPHASEPGAMPHSAGSIGGAGAAGARAGTGGGRPSPK